MRSSTLFSFFCIVLSTTRVTALRILLTNNNGCFDDPSSPGEGDGGVDNNAVVAVQLLRQSLTGAGHEVTTVCPSQALNGVSGALTLPLVNVTAVDATPDAYRVDGFIATAVLVGMTIMTTNGGTLPDLIIAGINPGFTSGHQDLHSGTVIGGALTGLSRGIPSLAVMTDAPVDASDQYFSRAAALTTTVIDTLDFTLFPRGVGLKLSFPDTDLQTVNGIVLAETNQDFVLTFDYTPNPDDSSQLDATIVEFDNPSLDPNSETSLVLGGRVTVTPLQSDISVYAARYNENFLAELEVTLAGISSTAR